VCFFSYMAPVYLPFCRARPAPAPAVENPSGATDFSIERILSADLGNKTPVERTPSPALPGSFALPYLQCVFYPSYPVTAMAIDPQAFTYNVTVCGAGQICQDVRQAQQQQQWKPRVRTVFTDSQLQRLEELFEQTRYPCPETREEMAQNIGLSEDTIRIWFKNHRARRKRQTNAPGVQKLKANISSQKVAIMDNMQKCQRQALLFLLGQGLFSLIQIN
uniref:Homeobox domain-containing protein n=1 Tax=Neogobius melanostomus TaxID=47308 RepID=A0A8C6TV38_9GOBI